MSRLRKKPTLIKLYFVVFVILYLFSSHLWTDWERWRLLRPINHLFLSSIVPTNGNCLTDNLFIFRHDRISIYTFEWKQVTCIHKKNQQTITFLDCSRHKTENKIYLIHNRKKATSSKQGLRDRSDVFDAIASCADMTFFRLVEHSSKRKKCVGLHIDVTT